VLGGSRFGSSSVDGRRPAPATPGIVKLLLPPRQSRGISLVIRFDARSGKPVDVYFADKVAAGGLLVRSLTPDALVQQNANITPILPRASMRRFGGCRPRISERLPIVSRLFPQNRG
jgi:hypothetical protein